MDFGPKREWGIGWSLSSPKFAVARIAFFQPSFGLFPLAASSQFVCRVPKDTALASPRSCSFMIMVLASNGVTASLDRVLDELAVMPSNGGCIDADGEDDDLPLDQQRSGELLDGPVAQATTSTRAKRPFCERCRKAQKLCICSRFKGVVKNKIRVTIMQHPEEKNHPIGSTRIAALGLENVAIVSVPEFDSHRSFRIRPKVPGSKRSIAGRGGKKSPFKEGNHKDMDQNASESEALRVSCLLAEILDVSSMDGFRLEKQNRIKEDVNVAAMPCLIPLMPASLETIIPSGVALLYPSEKAIELSHSLFTAPRLNPSEMISTRGTLVEDYPSHLIVLDGTWSKAKRIYFENPWLHSIPYYKLPPGIPSLYEGVRRQPKLGCLSTVESIIYALKLLEPETEGLDRLLQVFDSMVEDQRRCKQMRYCSKLINAS